MPGLCARRTSWGCSAGCLYTPFARSQMLAEAHNCDPCSRGGAPLTLLRSAALPPAGLRRSSRPAFLAVNDEMKLALRR